MARKCPKCGYERKATDSAPEWQCPACGVAYAKVSSSSHSSTESVSNHAAKRKEPETSSRRPISPPVKLLLVSFVCLVVGLLDISQGVNI
ncbi:MAG: hypothetical protein ACUBOA_11355 [Candidatus Loosdrechtia sp.]|nr:hypothetical protein [Candidatus Kuenenia stuttgartiensis]